VPISVRRLDARDAHHRREAFSHALRSNLFRGEHVREWVFGRGRYIVLTNRRVLSLLDDGGAVELEWAALHVTVTGARVRRLGFELVVRRGDHETRVHVHGPFRRQARALAAAL
jgi:hypothetical protein